MIKQMWLCWKTGEMYATGFLVNTKEEAKAWVGDDTRRTSIAMELKWVNNYGKEFPVEQ